MESTKIRHSTYLRPGAGRVKKTSYSTLSRQRQQINLMQTMKALTALFCDLPPSTATDKSMESNNAPLLRLRAMTTPSTALLAAMILLWSQLPSNAITQVRANAGSSTAENNTFEKIASSGSVSDAESGPNLFGSGTGRASASFGVLRAYGYAETVLGYNSSLYSVYSFNSASWSDDFLYSSEALNGTAGSVPMRFTIDGTLSFNSAGSVPQFINGTGYYSYIEASLGTDNGQGSGILRETLYLNGQYENNPSFLGIEQVVTFNFIWGTPLTGVKLRLNANVNAAGSNSGYTSSAIANGENTATWGGFGTVLDSNGNPVTNYTFSSGSGTNYAQAIPEPGTGTLLAAAGLLAALARRRRR